ncbi:MAG: hypothetical protein JXR89_04020, partial [Deltaproteobacteria bacterium]|nr:hypothetical protein [Deltaproteobacteria bacterium]
MGVLKKTTGAGLGIGGKYLLGVAGLVLLGVILLFSRQFHKEKSFILAQLEGQARLLGRQVLLTRSWLSDQGGVFLPLRPGRTPFLQDSEAVL